VLFDIAEKTLSGIHRVPTSNGKTQEWIKVQTCEGAVKTTHSTQNMTRDGIERAFVRVQNKPKSINEPETSNGDG
jgi:hypothetical protein